MSKRIIGWMLFILSVLMIPLMAMRFTNEVQWVITDFLVAGGILVVIAVAYEIVLRREPSSMYRYALAIGLLGSLLLFWVNAAVGIIGSEDQDVNLLYGAVLLIVLIGSTMSRLKPRGMSITLYVATAFQMLIPVVALIIWPPQAISWSPGVVEVFLLSSFFALLFCVSAMLFDRVASSQTKDRSDTSGAEL